MYGWIAYWWSDLTGWGSHWCETKEEAEKIAARIPDSFVAEDGPVLADRSTRSW